MRLRPEQPRRAIARASRRTALSTKALTSLRMWKMHSWCRAAGHNSDSTAGYRGEPSETTTFGSSPPVLRFFRNRRMCAWSFRPTRAKPTGISLTGSVASSSVKRPR